MSPLIALLNTKRLTKPSRFAILRTQRANKPPELP